MPSSRLSESEWRSLIADYHKRDCTQEEFCRKRGVKPATLSYYVSRFRKKPKKFLPLEVQAEPVSKEVVLEFPSGLKLSIHGS